MLINNYTQLITLIIIIIRCFRVKDSIFHKMLKIYVGLTINYNKIIPSYLIWILNFCRSIYIFQLKVLIRTLNGLKYHCQILAIVFLIFSRFLSKLFTIRHNNMNIIIVLYQRFSTAVTRNITGKREKN